jgi:hypothetical protein
VIVACSAAAGMDAVERGGVVVGCRPGRNAHGSDFV